MLLVFTLQEFRNLNPNSENGYSVFRLLKLQKVFKNSVQSTGSVNLMSIYSIRSAHLINYFEEINNIKHAANVLKIPAHERRLSKKILRQETFRGFYSPPASRTQKFGFTNIRTKGL